MIASSCAAGSWVSKLAGSRTIGFRNPAWAGPMRRVEVRKVTARVSPRRALRCGQASGMRVDSRWVSRWTLRAAKMSRAERAATPASQNTGSQEIQAMVSAAMMARESASPDPSVRLRGVSSRTAPGRLKSA